MMLSRHFTLDELTASQTATRMGREIVPTPEQLANLQRLAELVLEPLRIQLGRPVVISSGLRPAWLNEQIGGAKNSAHLTGRAADITTIGMTPDTLARFIRNHGFPVDQVIVEFGRWVHVAVAEDGRPPRNEYLTASLVGGRTQYEVMA